MTSRTVSLFPTATPQSPTNTACLGTMDLIQSVWNDPDKPYGDDEIVHWVLQDLYNMCNKDGMNFREILDMIRHLEEILEITGAVPLLERFSEERLLEAFDVVETGTEQTS